MRKAVTTFALAALAGLAAPATGAPAAPPAELAAEVERAETLRRDSPTAALKLSHELRQRADMRAAPNLVARLWLNICQASIEEDNLAARRAAEEGRTLLSRGDPSTRALDFRLRKCALEAAEYFDTFENVEAGYTELVDEAAASGEVLLEAHARDDRGQLRGFLGHYSSALEDLDFACREFRARQMTAESMDCLRGVAVLNLRMKDWDRAIEYLRTATQGQRSLGNRYEYADSAFNMARAFIGKGDHDAAARQLDEALDLYRVLERPTSVAYVQAERSRIALARKHAGAALNLADAALHRFREIGDQEMSARLQTVRARSLLALGRDADALTAAGEAERLYAGLQYKPGLQETYGVLADVHTALGRHADAGRALRTQRDLAGLLQSEREQLLVAETRARFELDERKRGEAILAERNTLMETALESSREAGHLKSVAIGLGGALLAALAMLVWQQRRQMRRIGKLALVDDLTGLSNRRDILAFLAAQAQQHILTGKPLSVLLLDVDRFKDVNDRHGHAAGDAVLRLMARRCQDILAGRGRLGRTGGEEFLLILPETTLADAVTVGEALCAGVRALDLSAVAPGLRISVSAGASQWKPDDAQSTAVVARADKALYEAKRGGRDRVAVAPDRTAAERVPA